MEDKYVQDLYINTNTRGENCFQCDGLEYRCVTFFVNKGLSDKCVYRIAVDNILEEIKVGRKISVKNTLSKYCWYI